MAYLHLDCPVLSSGIVQTCKSRPTLCVARKNGVRLIKKKPLGEIILQFSKQVSPSNYEDLERTN